MLIIFLSGFIVEHFALDYVQIVSGKDSHRELFENTSYYDH